MVQGCWQICLRASVLQQKEATPFLQEGCTQLRQAFGFDGLLLKPAGQAAPPQGPTLIWCPSAHPHLHMSRNQLPI